MNNGVLGKEQEAYLESSRAKELVLEAFNARGGVGGGGGGGGRRPGGGL